MQVLLYLLLLGAAAFGQISHRKVIGVTNTQAAVSYITSHTGACYAEVSESPGYAPAVHDVNDMYFSGSDSDARFSALRDGHQRYFVVGTRAVQADVNGVNRSRALQAWTTHYLRMTCNGSSATAMFMTKTVPFGNTFADPMPAATTISSARGWKRNYVWPTLNPMYHDNKIIDPYTGVRLQYVNMDAWAQGATTAAGGLAFSGASADAGWTPTSSTLIAAVTTSSDGNVATSSTTDKLRLQLSTGNVLVDGTFPAAALSYQNLDLRYRCVGAGCATAVAHICVTENLNDTVPECEPPEKTWTNLATTMTDLVICYDIPCTTQKAHGDWWTYDKIYLNGQYTTGKRGDYNVYTTTGADATLKFINQADCDRLIVGDILGVYKSTTNTDHRIRTTVMSCGSSPPQATVEQIDSNGIAIANVALDHNGTLGLPFQYKSGIGNPRYGFLLWVTGADAVLEVDRVRWIAAKETGMSLSPGSGGFGKKSTYSKSSNGFYHAFCGLECVMGYKPEADGSTTVRYLGWNTPHSSSIGSYVGSGFKNCDGSTGNNSPWHDTDPNVLYCAVDSNYPALNGAPANRRILLKLTYTGNDVARNPPCAVYDGSACGTYGAMQGGGLPVTIENLTPCLGDCTDPDLDFTIFAQLKRVAGAAFDGTKYGGCAPGVQQGNYMIGGCGAGSQDSWPLMFIFDLGNGGIPGSTYVGSSGNTQQIVTFLDPNFKKYSQWCGNHTYQGPNGMSDSNFAVVEVDAGKCFLRTTISTNMTSCNNTSGSGTCQACPGDIGTVDGVDYTDTNRCWDVTLSSSGLWNGAWGSLPAVYEEGDPVGYDINEGLCGTVRWLGGFQPGSLLCRGGECIKFLKKIAIGRWWVERQFGTRYAGSGSASTNHGTDSSWATKCNAMELNSNIARTETYFGGWMWRYLEDPNATGAGTTYTWTRFNNHAFHAVMRSGVGVRAVPKFIVEKVDFGNAAAMAAMPQYNVGDAVAPNAISANGWCTAGQCGDSYGNQLESHPSMSQFNAPLERQRAFVDIHPINFLTLRNAGTALTMSNVTGYLWKFGTPNAFTRKHNVLAAVSGLYPFVNISAPGAMLTGSASDNGKVCIVYVAGECYAGSSVGEIYWTSTTMDGQPNCREAEFAASPGDKCFTNLPPHGASLSEYLIPGEGQLKLGNLRGARVLTKMFMPYRQPVTANAKASPDGSRILMRDDNIIVTVPPIPLLDTIDRSEFQAHTLSIKDVPAGTDNVIVRFGYDTSMICSPNRAELCVATEAAINRTTPYSYPSEGTGGVESGLTGLSCASTCSVSLPLIPDRMAFYQVVYRNSGGSVLRADPLKSVAK